MLTSSMNTFFIIKNLKVLDPYILRINKHDEWEIE